MAPVALARADRRALPPIVLATVVVAWLMAIGGSSSGIAVRLSHDWLIHSHLSLAAAELLFLAGWIVMVTAMMLPAASPAITLARKLGSRSGVAQFLGGYLALWMVCGALLFTGDIGIHGMVDRVAWLGARPWMVGAATLAVAGVFQLIPLKARCLSACRDPRVCADPRPWVFALRYGRACLGCDGPLMLAMFGAGLASLGWMAGLAAAMRYEVTGRNPSLLRVGLGGLLLLWAVLMAAHPGWLPGPLADLS